MIALTFAIPAESQELVHHLSHPGQILPGPLPVILGNLGPIEIAICHTGIGSSRVRAGLAHVMTLERPQALIAAGFAGGLDPSLRTGDVLVASNFSDPALLEQAVQAGARRATFTTQTATVESATRKNRLAKDTGADAVEMETAAIATLCASAGIPLVAVRSVLDEVDQDLPLPFDTWFDAGRQRPRAGGVARHLARHPGRIVPFLRFLGDVNKARHRLTSHLLQLVRSVDGQ